VLSNPLDNTHDGKRLPWYNSICEKGDYSDGETVEQFKQLFENLPVDPLAIK
jgi:hypothetical protein